MAAQSRTPSQRGSTGGRGIVGVAAVALIVAASILATSVRTREARGGDVVPIRAMQAEPAGGSTAPPLVPIGVAPAISASGATPSSSGLPPLRPISQAPLPQAAWADRSSPELHRLGTPAAMPSPPIAIRSIPVTPDVPRRTAGMAALGLTPIQSTPPGPTEPVVARPLIPPPLPREVPPIPAPTAVASLPAPWPKPISYAPLPVVPESPMLPPVPAIGAAPMLPPPLPVAATAPPPISVAASPPPAPAAAPAASALPQPPSPMPPAPAAIAAAQPPLPAAAPAPSPGKPADAVMIASFNIQVFGESKLAKPQVVDVLTRVVRQFDIVAVQEVRAKSDSVVPTFVAAINADGSRYQYVIGPRLGRTASKEQYTFIYDTNRIELDPSSVGTLPNPGDKFHRPPLRARFRVRTNPPEAGFSFWLVDIHTDPDEVPQEVDALADAFVSMRSFRPDEDDVIVLGDLNAGPPQFGRIKQIPGIGWAVSGVTTNTRRTKTYDNLIFDRTVTGEYTGRWGVLDLQNTFGIPLDKALEVSDHNPVWAAFSPWEMQRVAGPATAPPR